MEDSKKPEIILRQNPLINLSFTSDEDSLSNGPAKFLATDAIEETGSVMGAPTTKLYFGFTKRQMLFLLIFGAMNLFRGVAVLINGPFFPPEAEDKGVSARTIGFIFGAFDYTIIVASILYGKFIIPAVGPSLVVKLSILTTGICTILFGCAVLLNEHDAFVISCFVIRILGGAGDAGLYPALLTIFALEFADSISTALGVLEVFFGIGAIIGPIFCGYLIEIISYTWVYTIVGLCILATGIIGIFCTPTLISSQISTDLEIKVSSIDNEKISSNKTEETSHGFLMVLRNPKVILAMFGLFVAASSIGYITATLELHMEEFDLSPSMTGGVFSAGTGVYMLFSLGWGYVADKTKVSKNYIIIVGAFFIALSFSFLGPLPFLPWEKRLWAMFVGYGLHGIGIGASIMSAYYHALQATLEAGFPDNADTYGIVSGIYTCTFSLGNAFGASIGGVLFDSVGFRWGTMLIIGLSILVGLCALLLSLVQKLNVFSNAIIKSQ